MCRGCASPSTHVNNGICIYTHTATASGNLSLICMCDPPSFLGRVIHSIVCCVDRMCRRLFLWYTSMHGCGWCTFPVRFHTRFWNAFLVSVYCLAGEISKHCVFDAFPLRSMDPKCNLQQARKHSWPFPKYTLVENAQMWTWPTRHHFKKDCSAFLQKAT